MRNPGAYIIGFLVVLALNFAWFIGGDAVARRLGFTGRWAIYKGQMIIFLPIFILGWAMMLWSGVLWR